MSVSVCECVSVWGGGRDDPRPAVECETERSIESGALAAAPGCSLWVLGSPHAHHYGGCRWVVRMKKSEKREIRVWSFKMCVNTRQITEMAWGCPPAPFLSGAAKSFGRLSQLELPRQVTRVVRRWFR